MIREEIVFGPIMSRRLGHSLGINILSRKGKLCNFDCVYCECGWNKDGRDNDDIPVPEDLRSALDTRLAECLEDGTLIDSITFSGDGEPTLNPHFPEMVDITLELRDKYFPEAKVSVLTNATRLVVDSVREALMKVDNPILKLDAASNAGAALINKPQGAYDVGRVVEEMAKFGGNFVLQTMMLRSESFDSADSGQISAWMDIVRSLKPRLVTVYSIDRPAPSDALVKYSAEEMRSMVQPLVNEGYNIKIYG